MKKKPIIVGKSVTNTKAHVRWVDDIPQPNATWVDTFGTVANLKDALKPKPIPSTPVIQANKPGTMGRMLDALADGVNSSESLAAACGLSDRQGDYYAYALMSLDLVYPVAGTDPTQFDFTQTGADFVNGSIDDRIFFMCEAIEINPDLQAYLDEDETYFDNRMDGFQDSTRERRMSALKSLTDFADGDHESQYAEIGEAFTKQRNVKEGIRPKGVPGFISKGHSSRPKGLAMITCEECWMQYNADRDICPNC